MKPPRPRPRFWPIAALPAAGMIAMIAAASGLSRGQSAVSTPKNGVPLDPIATAPLVKPHATSSDRQISYEVRYLNLLTEPWRQLMKDRLKLVQQEADVSVWIIEKQSLASLLNHAQTPAGGNVLQAPKVTTFENDHATIFSEKKQHYVAQVEKVETSGGMGFRPIVKEIGIGWRVDVVGSFLPDGTNASVDVRDSNLVAMHALTRKERFGDQDVSATYQVPSMIEHRCRVAYAVPDESSLVISLGLQINETPIFAGVTEVAGKLFESMGLSRHEPARSATCERLVVITPRRIVLESAEDRSGVAPTKAVFGAPPK